MCRKSLIVCYLDSLEMSQKCGIFEKRLRIEGHLIMSSKERRRMLVLERIRERGGCVDGWVRMMLELDADFRVRVVYQAGVGSSVGIWRGLFGLFD